MSGARVAVLERAALTAVPAPRAPFVARAHHGGAGRGKAASRAGFAGLGFAAACRSRVRE